MRKKTATAFVIIACTIAWVLWLGSAAVFGMVSKQYILSLSLGMYAPGLAAVIVSRGISGKKTGIGWRPAVKGNVRWYLAALLVPAALTVLGGAVFFLVFPHCFDAELSLLAMIIDGSGLTPWQYLGMALVQCVTVGPFINAVFAIGEEAGWRGYLYPRLSARFGRRRGYILGGVIWGLWHAPIIVLGHNYGVEYWGYPVTGVLAMCVFCIAAGTALAFLYEKSGSVWPCAIAHGAVNAVAALPGYMMMPGAKYSPLLGPAQTGLVAALPLIVLAAALLLRRDEPKRAETEEAPPA